MPDATARPGSANYRAAMRRLLDEWNAGLARLDEALGSNRDRKRTLAPYGDELQPDDRKQIPEHDMPPGTPPWMRSLKQWATRKRHNRRRQARHDRSRGPHGRTPLAITRLTGLATGRPRASAGRAGRSPFTRPWGTLSVATSRDNDAASSGPAKASRSGTGCPRPAP
jgi:hypothetical protein